MSRRIQAISGQFRSTPPKTQTLVVSHVRGAFALANTNAGLRVEGILLAGCKSSLEALPHFTWKHCRASLEFVHFKFHDYQACAADFRLPRR